ncbi:MAG: VWA domain-containing protein [Ignavibacteriales bacterium]|nr:VWA domain-containing protein [Ignavibacteriales bacterium]
MPRFGDAFANPEFLWLLFLVPIAAAFWWRQRRRMITTIRFSSIEAFRAVPRTIRERIRHVPLAIRLMMTIVLIVALARPQSVSSTERMSTEGIDIVLVLDISGSMLAEDFTPNRLVAAQQVAEDFINGRTSDRIGLVIFSAESFTQCPLTTDYPVLTNLLHEVKNGMIADGTAIGLALANAVNRLKDSKAKSKVIILLTDGVNNRGEIDPLTAATIASTYGIRTYTVGVGARGMAPYPVQTPFGTRRQMVPVDLDEKTLETVASMTGGRYFRATDNEKLIAIYREIDQLERTKIEITAYKKTTDLFPGWLTLGMILFGLEIILSNVIIRKTP